METITKRVFETDFKEWFIQQPELMKMFNHIVYNEKWEGIPKSMIWGVMVDFFDSVGIYIEVTNWTSHGLLIFFVPHVIKEGSSSSEMKHTDTRTEAREKALEKAREIYEK